MHIVAVMSATAATLVKPADVEIADIGMHLFYRESGRPSDAAPLPASSLRSEIQVTATFGDQTRTASLSLECGE